MEPRISFGGSHQRVGLQEVIPSFPALARSALAILAGMERPDVIACSGAIAACEKGWQWRGAWSRRTCEYPLLQIPGLFAGYQVHPVLKKEVFTMENQVFQKLS